MIKEFIITESFDGTLGGRLSFKTKQDDVLTTKNLPLELVQKLELTLKDYINQQYKNIL